MKPNSPITYYLGKNPVGQRVNLSEHRDVGGCESRDTECGSRPRCVASAPVVWNGQTGDGLAEGIATTPEFSRRDRPGKIRAHEEGAGRRATGTMRAVLINGATGGAVLLTARGGNAVDAFLYTKPWVCG